MAGEAATAADVVDISVQAEKKKNPAGPEAPQLRERVGPPRFKIERGGEPEKVGLSGDVRAELSKHIRDRLEIAKDLDKDPSKPRLNDYDRLLLQGGDAFVDRVAGRDALTDAELAVAWTVVLDELTQKSSVSRLELDQEGGRFQRLRDVPGVGRIIRRFSRDDTLRVSATEGPHFSSAYLDKLGYATWDGDRKANDLVALNGVREAIEKELGVPPAGEIPDFSKKNGNRIHDATTEAVGRILAREHNGITFLELQDRDPVKAVQVRQRAMQEGLTQFAGEQAVSLLQSEKPKVDTVSIDAHIANLSKRASTSQLESLQTQATEGGEKFNEETSRYQELRTELKNAQTEVQTATFDLQKAEASRDAQNPVDPASGIRVFDQQIIDISADIRSNQGEIHRLSTAPPAGMDEDAIERYKAHYASLINDDRERIKDILDKKGTLDDAVGSADARQKYYQARITAIEGKSGELAKAKAAAERARKSRDKATKALHEGQEGLTPVKSVQVDALRQWKKVGTEGYAKIMDERFDQHRGDRLTAAKMGSTAELDGQIVGAEKIREHIFRITDPEWWTKEENRDLARRMLSDEAIAKGIIETFRIDTGGKTVTIAGVGNVTYADCFMEIGYRRQTLETARDKLIEEKAKGTTGAALKPFEDAVDVAKKEIQTYEKPLLKDLLPNLQNANEFQIGDTMRYLVRQGLDSAADGNPFWNGEQGEAYLKPDAELMLEVESILAQDKGKATFVETNMRGYGSAPRVEWEGELDHVQNAVFGFPIIDPTNELTFRVSQDLDRTEVSAVVDVLINENFLQALPLRLPPTIAPEIRDLFYDMSQTPPTLRREIRARDRSAMERMFRSSGSEIDNRGNMWITVLDDSLRRNSSTQMLNLIDGSVAPDASTHIAVATANTVLEMTPSQRLNVVKGLHEVFVPGVQHLESPGTIVDYAIQFDNDGNLWVMNNAGGERQILENFYAEREEAYRNSLGVQTLNPAQRAQLQGELIKIQEQIGRDILLRQQRR